MPNTKSAKKELNKSDKRRQINQKIKGDLKKTIKTSAKRVQNKDVNLKQDIAKIVKEIDKAAQKRIIKKNKAARQKSRLVKKINSIQ